MFDIMIKMRGLLLVLLLLVGTMANYSAIMGCGKCATASLGSRCLKLKGEGIDGEVQTADEFGLCNQLAEPIEFHFQCGPKCKNSCTVRFNSPFGKISACSDQAPMMLAGLDAIYSRSQGNAYGEVIDHEWCRCNAVPTLKPIKPARQSNEVAEQKVGNKIVADCGACTSKRGSCTNMDGGGFNKFQKPLPPGRSCKALPMGKAIVLPATTEFVCNSGCGDGCLIKMYDAGTFKLNACSNSRFGQFITWLYDNIYLQVDKNSKTNPKDWCNCDQVDGDIDIINGGGNLDKQP